jgi:hypothetical protein
LIVDDDAVFRYTFESDDPWCVRRLDYYDDLAIRVLRSCKFDRLCRIRGRMEWHPHRFDWDKIYRAYDLEGAGGVHELFVARPEPCAKTAPVPPFNRELAIRLEACRKAGHDTGEVPFPQPRLKDLQVEASKIDWFAVEVDVQRLKWPGASEDQHRLMAGYLEFYRAMPPGILTITDLRVLEVLVYKPRDLTSIAAIAEAAAMSPSTVTTVINRLTVIGVLTRKVGRGRRPTDYEIHPEWLVNGWRGKNNASEPKAKNIALIARPTRRARTAMQFGE